MMIYWGSAASLLFFIGVAFIFDHFLNFQGQTWYLFMALMSMLGLTSSAFFYYIQNKFKARKEQRQAAAAAVAQGGAPGAPVPDAGQASLWIKEANSRLAQSKPGVGVENLPMMFVIGDRGTAKTSSILNSGLEPELLAGQVYQDNIVTPTRGANIFYARDTVFVEAGGALMANPGAWKNLVTKLRPGRLKSLIGGGGQAPRAVLLCFDLEAFTRQGAAEAVAAAARYLQERLGDISQTLGINFPVYVLFTRADRLPFFADWVHNLTNEEAGQVVGVTLPMRSTSAQGVYAETETNRLTASFNALFHAFCDHRLMILPRESDPVKIPGAYEFPREFRKLRNMLVQFMVDLARPSQLRASPFLRGFYFTGVRPVEVRDVAPAGPVAAAPQAQETGGGATRMFRAGFQAEQRAAQAYAPQFAATRKLPQWLFLGHLFTEVLLADNAARAASGSSIKTSLTKRVLLAAAAFVFLFYSAMLLISYFGNNSLENTAIVAARNIGNADVLSGNLPTQDALIRLDTLRTSLQQISDYRANGAPWHLRWGLYSGNDMLLSLRRVYYNKFRQVLFGSTQGSMLAFLQTVPATPGPQDDYGKAYDTLKTYLLTTSEWKRSSEPSLQAFLASRLLSRWSAGKETEIGPDRMTLAKAQFDFYARDLKNGNPFSASGDGAAIEHSRLYLAGFTGVQRVYQFLLSEAAKTTPPTTFNQKFPGTAEVVSSGVEVAFAFTKDGWTFMQDQIRKQNFSGELWVLGQYRGQGLDQATMAKGILDLYTKDYIDQWRRVLRGSRVSAYANFPDAARKLTLLTSPSAPLLALFWWTSQNTAIDLPGISDKFQPVQVVSPPGGAQQYILPANQNYNNSLIALQSAVQRAATAPSPSQDPGWPPVKDAAVTSARQLASAFRPDPEGHVDQTSMDLLIQPTDLDRLGQVDISAAGQRFCAAFNGLTSKFPFQSTAVPEVTLNELADILKPGTGKLFAFAMQLSSRLQCQNGQCTASGGSPPLSPVFVSYMNQMMQFSRALYSDNGADPNYRYKLRPSPSDQVESFDITINGETVKLKGGAQHDYVWPGPNKPNFSLTLHAVDGGTSGVPPWDTQWAVFRFFADADSVTSAPNGATFSWRPRQGAAGRPQLGPDGKPLHYEFFVDTGGAPAVFSKDFLSKLRCVGPFGGR
ncbi:MAG TPA: ImcF-related family protein [Bryobacteraceae bacterium]|nr:ImcF-related family protein [Bryobacteraceae bacterium]